MDGIKPTLSELEKFVEQPEGLDIECALKVVVNLLRCIMQRKKSNLHYARDIMPKRVTSGGLISAA